MLYILILFVIVKLVVGISLSESLSLNALYTSTSGEYWTWKSLSVQKIWNFTYVQGRVVNDPCSDDGVSWQGVVCNDTAINCAYSPCNIKNLVLSGSLVCFL